MDVALVLDRGDRDFHYSPLKLKEYMACGKAVVGPEVGELARDVKDGVEGFLVRPGDAESLAGAIEHLHRDPEHRRELGLAAREKAVREWTWDRQLSRVLDALDRVPSGVR
jgi:glycosyltransferase involved in cell wall biosynthesis